MALFDSLSDRLQDLTAKFRGKSRVTEQDIKEMLKEIRVAFLEADVNYQVVKEFTKVIAEKAKGEEVLSSLTPGQQIIKIVNEELEAILGEGSTKLEFNPSGFTTIMLYGLQGAGKTTTAAKLAKFLSKKGKKPFLVSVDTHRPAAQEQLKILAEQINVPVYIEPEEKNAAKIAQRGLDRAKYLMCDVLIVDTAGRTIINAELMDELKEINSVVNPDERLLIVDAMIGQEAVNVANAFNEQIGLDGFIMTKLDGDARGGAALSIYKMTGKPIKFVGEFTLDDMVDMLDQIQNMGPMKNILGMIPGISNKQLNEIDVDDRQLDYTKAIIYSMTPAERADVKLLNASRRKRIASGSGRTVQEVNKLVKQYDEMLKTMNKMGITGKGKKGKKRKGFGGFNPFKGLGGF